MTSLSTLPACFVRELWIEDILFSSDFLGLLLLSLLSDLVFHLLDQLHLLLLMLLLHLSHIFSNLVRLIFVELGDFLLEDVGADSGELFGTALDELNGLNRRLLEGVWLRDQSLFESLLNRCELVVDIRYFITIFAPTMGLVIVHGFLGRILAE